MIDIENINEDLENIYSIDKSINDEKLIEFDKSLHSVLLNLAKRIAADGEGSSKFISVNVLNAKTFFDIKRLVQTRVELLSEKNNHKPIPFVGAIYLKQNWQLVVEQLKKSIKSNTKTDGEKIPELVWIAPNDPFWGKSHRLASCISELIDNESSKGKKAQRLYNTKIYLPLLTEANPKRIFEQIKYGKIKIAIRSNRKDKRL